MRMKTINKKTFFDEEYFEGHTKAIRPPYSRNLVYPQFLYIAKMLKRLTQPKTILDLGCAKGYMVEAFLNLEIEDVWGVDISKYAIYNSPKEIRHRLVVGDIEEGIPFETDIFDLITAFDLFEHLQHPSRVFKESARVLKKGGKMYVVICGEKSPNAIKDLSHINIRPYKEWKEIIEKSNFVIIDAQDVNGDYRIMMEWK